MVLALAGADGIVRFGAFELDPRSGELWRAGQPVPLQQQPFEVLIRLLARPSEVVTREALQRELWPDASYGDFEHGLNAAIKRLRDALGDSADAPRFVETLPRRGYRFIGDVAVPASNDPAAAQAGPPARPQRRSWALIGLVAAALLAATAAWLAIARSPALTDRDTIVVADFVNRSGEEVFDGTLRLALTIQLEQSPFLAVVSRERVTKALRQMTQPADALVLGGVAREACQRVGAKVTVNGSIARVGTRYVIGLEALDCATGDAVADEQTQTNAREDVIDALGKTASRLRRRLGESRATLQRFDRPLAEATTSSLDALQVYTVGEQTRERIGEGRGEPYFRRAIELDPEFAMAHARLSTIAANTGRAEEMRRTLKEALARRGRVTERERLYLDYRECLTFGSPPCGENVAEVWRRTYPRDWEPYMDLCWSHAQVNAQYEKALGYCREAARLGPDRVMAVVNLTGVYESLNRFQDAKRVTDDALARGIDTLLVRRMRYDLAFIAGDRTAMAAERRAIAGDPEEAQFVLLEADAAAFLGRFVDARAARDRAEALAAGRLNELRDFIRSSGAVWETAAGFPTRIPVPEAGRQSARDLLPFLSTLQGDGRRTEALLASTDIGVSTQRIAIPARTLLALEAGDASAIDRLSAVGDPRDLAAKVEYRSIYLRGLAFLRAGRGAAAAAEFQRILDHRGIAPTSPLYALAYVQQARGYALAGDRTKARAAYERFFILWKDADPDVPILLDARRECAQLGGTPP